MPLRILEDERHDSCNRGAGFIGTHACAALADAGIPTLLLDNFSNNG